MAKFINNEPKFKVGDKVIYSRRRNGMCSWEKESISKGPLTIYRVDKRYENDILVDVSYFIEGLDYVYSEDWLSYAPASQKFKIGDLVRLYLLGRREGRYRVIERHYIVCEDPAYSTDVLMVHYQKDGHEEYFYRLAGWPADVPERNLTIEVTSEEGQLIRDLEICGGENGCKGCSRDNPDGTGTGCDKLELDAAELIKKLQKRVNRQLLRADYRM